MEYEPSLPDESINQSKEHPLKDVLSMIFQVSLFIGVLYWGLGYLADYIAGNIPLELEKKYLSFTSKYEEKKFDEVNLYLNNLKDNLLINKKEKENISIYFYCDDESNAFALPGGNILINSKTIEVLKSENALSYIIGHEIGHVLNRDIIRGMGRGVVSALLLSFISLGQKSAELVFNLASLSFSREIESRADKIAEGLSLKAYGNLKGSNEFFNYHMSKNKDLEWLKFFSTHPSLKDRVREGGNFEEGLKLIPKQFKSLCEQPDKKK